VRPIRLANIILIFSRRHPAIQFWHGPSRTQDYDWPVDNADSVLTDLVWNVCTPFDHNSAESRIKTVPSWRIRLRTNSHRGTTYCRTNIRVLVGDEYKTFTIPTRQLLSRSLKASHPSSTLSDEKNGLSMSIRGKYLADADTVQCSDIPWSLQGVWWILDLRENWHCIVKNDRRCFRFNRRFGTRYVR
jgi:hypothetical protein